MNDDERAEVMRLVRVWLVAGFLVATMGGVWIGYTIWGTS